VIGADGGTPLYGFGLTSPAIEVLDPWQRRLLVVSLGLVSAVASLSPGLLPIGAGGGCAAVLILVSAFRAWTVLTAFRRRDRPSAGTPALPDRELPRYTLLVPLYREANMVGALAEHLRRLDYPSDRLQILLLCEAEDVSTIEVVERLGLDDRFQLVVCPPGTPRTKPRACNIGLLRATGDLCVVYDAEDRPESDQLRRAAARFAASDPAVVCLQARLDYYDANRNWLARCFSVEYAILFRLILPGLVASNLPVPLGGTSNHFRMGHLRRLGGWDPHNVTEDADLGMRIYRSGLRTEMLDSTTFEEPCARLRPWVRQRTRWMKGYLQTWLVHSRNPGSGLSGRSRLALHLVIGGSPVGAAALPLAAIVLCVLAGLPATVPSLRPLAPVLAVAVGANTAMHGVSIALARRLRPGWRLCRGVASMTLYSLLVSFATYRAVWHLARRPHHWEKTPHGLFPGGAEPDVAAGSPRPGG